jgi:Flp pilus assembly protein TadG
MRTIKSILRGHGMPRAGKARAFGRDDRGATLIEFGLLAIPFFAVIGAILETSLIFFAGQVLDSSVETSARLIRTGQAQTSNYTSSSFKAAMCSNTYGLFGDCSGVNIKVTILSGYTNAAATPPAYVNGQWTFTTCYQPGAGDQVIMVQAYYHWPVLLDFGGFNLQTSADGTHLLSAVRVFNNEPFGGNQTAATCT